MAKRPKKSTMKPKKMPMKPMCAPETMTKAELQALEKGYCFGLPM